MPRLIEEISATLHDGMVVPDSLARLFTWIEDRGLFEDNHEGRFGFLHDESADEHSKDEDSTEESDVEVILGGTDITFSAHQSNEQFVRLAGSDHPALLERLCIFALTGMDGSTAAFWLDDDGRQRIVHIGSGSGSGLLCVLADDAVDFLRLIAIGYPEICWPELLAYPLNGNSPDSFTHPNRKYQQWVRQTFNVEIPDTGTEIVRTPASMHDSESDDPFWRWWMKH